MRDILEVVWEVKGIMGRFPQHLVPRVLCLPFLPTVPNDRECKLREGRFSEILGAGDLLISSSKTGRF